MESGGKSFLESVKTGYDELAILYPDRIKIINGKDTISNVQDRIRKIINEKYKGLVC